MEAVDSFTGLEDFKPPDVATLAPHDVAVSIRNACATYSPGQQQAKSRRMSMVSDFAFDGACFEVPVPRAVWPIQAHPRYGPLVLRHHRGA